MKPSQEAGPSTENMVQANKIWEWLKARGLVMSADLGEDAVIITTIAEALDKTRREEREECAQIADSYELEHSNPDPTFQNAFEIGCDDMSLAIAESIRARESY